MKFFWHITVEFEADNICEAEPVIDMAIEALTDDLEESDIKATVKDRQLDADQFQRDHQLLEAFVQEERG